MRLSVKILLLLVSYYFLIYGAFFADLFPAKLPVLNQRLGTILFNQTQKNLPGKESHVYCYYPGAATGYRYNMGEQMIRQAKSFSDCTGWYGIAEINEIATRN